MILLGVLAVPERKEYVERIKEEFRNIYGNNIIMIESYDSDHKGQPHNFEMLLDKTVKTIEELAKGETMSPIHFDYVVLTTDDISLSLSFRQRVEQALLMYDVVGCYSNRLQNVKEEIVNGTGKHVLYDQCVAYNRNVLNSKYVELFKQYADMPERTEKERRHYDVMNSHYIRDAGYRIGVIRPNIVKHLNIKSVLGHKIKCN